MASSSPLPPSPSHKCLSGCLLLVRSQALLAYHGCVACGGPQLYNGILAVFPEDWFWKGQAAGTGWHSMVMWLAGISVYNLQRGPALLDMLWEEGACVLPVFRQKGENRTIKTFSH